MTLVTCNVAYPLSKGSIYSLSDDRFRWAELAISYLRLSGSTRELNRRFESPLPQLRDLYDTIFADLEKIDGYNKKIVETTLRWLLYSQSKWTRQVSSLLEVIRVEHDDDTSRDTILAMAGDFVSWDKDQDEFRLAHISVKEYLQSKPEFEESFSHDQMAQTVLSYLNKEGFSPSVALFRNYPSDEDSSKLSSTFDYSRERPFTLRSRLLRPYSFERYAIDYWIDHFSRAHGPIGQKVRRPSQELQAVWKAFLAEKHNGTNSEFARWVGTTRVLDRSNEDCPPVGDYFSLFTVCEFDNDVDIPDASEDDCMSDSSLEDEDLDIESDCDSSTSSPRVHASQSGRRFDVSPQPKPTPFFLACQQGLQYVVEECLRNNLNTIWDETRYGMTGLDFALFGNQYHVVRSLIERGAIPTSAKNMDFASCKYITRAIMWSDVEILELVLVKVIENSEDPIEPHLVENIDFLLSVVNDSCFGEYRSTKETCDKLLERVNKNFIFVLNELDKLLKNRKVLENEGKSRDEEVQVLDAIIPILGWDRQHFDMFDRLCLFLKKAGWHLPGWAIYRFFFEGGTQEAKCRIIPMFVRADDITEELVCEILQKATIIENVDVIFCLLDQNPSITISEDMISTGLRNRSLPSEILEYLSKRSNCYITTSMMSIAMSSAFRSICEKLPTLLDFDQNFCFSDENLRRAISEGFDDNFLKGVISATDAGMEKISEPTVNEACRHHDEMLLKHLLTKWPDAPTSQRCLQSALPSVSSSKLLLERSHLAVTEKMVCSLIKNIWSEDRSTLMALLQVFSKYGLPVTDTTLETAIVTKDTELLHFLLANREPEKVLTTSVLRAACGSTVSVLKIVLEYRPESIVTDECLARAYGDIEKLNVIKRYGKRIVKIGDTGIILAVWKDSQEPFMELLRWDPQITFSDAVLFEIEKATQNRTWWRDVNEDSRTELFKLITAEQRVSTGGRDWLERLLKRSTEPPVDEWHPKFVDVEYMRKVQADYYVDLWNKWLHEHYDTLGLEIIDYQTRREKHKDIRRYGYG